MPSHSQYQQDFLKIAQDAVQNALALLADVRPDPRDPLAKTALQRAVTKLLITSNNLRLAPIPNSMQQATATGHRILPPGQAVAAL